jgi:predicted acyl esterase
MITIKIEKDVAVPMRDGLNLACNIFRPDKAGKFPVILAFTAFSKDGFWSADSNGWGKAYEPFSPTLTGSAVFEAEDPNFWVNHEYVLMIVDPRGFYRSPGQIRTAELDGVVGEHAILHQGLWARDMYDAIEWAAVQDWSNGNIGMSGVSILGFSQWRTAALNPPHLRAFIPWEAMTDYHRDVMFRGGIPDTEWGKMIGRHKLTPDPAFPPPRHEDPPTPSEEGEDEFLAKITLPALVCATWSSHGTHTRGSFRAFRKISSRQKWLYTHGRQEWSEFYTAEAQTLRRMFFDHFLKGVDSRILDIPRVRLEVRETLERYSVRHDRDFPLPGTRYKRLYLDAPGHRLTTNIRARQNKVSYESPDGRAIFDYRFERDSELTGYMSLKLWVSSDEADDMDIFVTLKKLDRDGKEVPFDAWLMLGRYPVAFGWLRLSRRILDPGKSEKWDPYQKGVIGPGNKMKPGEVVPCEIAVLPSSTLFREGDSLRLLISASYGAREIGSVPFGFNASVNQGRYSIHTGGKRGSCLLIPLAPIAGQSST